MMEDKLRLNTKLYGFTGIIGRRDYYLNCVIIAAIALFFTLPCTIWLNSRIQNYMDLFNLSKIFSQTPFLLKWWFISGIPLIFVLQASNITRRLNDINGKINTVLNIFILSITFLNNLSFFILPFGISCLLAIVGFIIGLIIVFKRGKITGTYPYDVTKEFNWGAFFGTWIWGLFNKSYKTLWMILLFFTPWAFYYQIYCGLKGNEWAFKNKKWKNVSVFNKTQKKQSIIYAIFIPILFIIIFILLGLCTALFITENTKNNPQATEQQINKLANLNSDKTSQEYIKNVNDFKQVQTENINNTENREQSPYFDSYIKEIQQEIKKNWEPPKGTESKSVVLLFTIMKDGTLLNVKIKNSSGIYEVDEAATNAIRLTFPYKALPSEYKGDRVNVEFTFDYKVLRGKNV